MDYGVFFPQRLAKLRLLKNVSAREMSLTIGQSSSYINSIENGKAFPSMQGFFYICEYLNVTPQEFFESDNVCPERLNELVEEAKKLDETSLSLVLSLIRRLNGSE